MLRSLFKPKWQHKNPDVRIKALQNLDGSSTELIGLAKADPSLDVRLQAIQCLLHIPTLKSLANESADGVADGVKSRVTELVLNQPSLTDLDQLYSLVDDIQIHQKVASNHDHPAAIRTQAIDIIDDQDLLFTIANTDNSKQIQYLAASKLTDYTQLKKLRKFTKTNKSLRNLLKEKGNELKKQQDFSDKLKGLCDEIEALSGKNKEKFLSLQQQWQKIPETIPTEDQQHFKAVSTAFENAYTAYQKEAAERQPLRDKAQALVKEQDDLIHALKYSAADFTQQDFINELQLIKSNWLLLKPQLAEEATLWEMKVDERLTVINKLFASMKSDFQSFEQMKKHCMKAEKMLSGKRTIQQKSIIELQKQWEQIKPSLMLDDHEFQASFNDSLNQLKKRMEKQKAQLASNTKKIELLLDAMEKSIEADQYKEAISAHQNVTRLFSNTQGMDKQVYSQIKRRITAATPTIRNAQSWRHWGTDNARAQLIERAKELVADTEIKPLERADQVKELRNEWKKFGKMDPSKHQKLWNEFDAACSKAYEPCQQYFKQESAQRDNNLKRRFDICEQLEKLEKQTDWKSVDWREVSKKINVQRGQWRKAGNINRSSWKTVNQRFNDAMDALEVHLGKERHRNWLQRKNLVTQAEALTVPFEKAEDIDVAIDHAIQTAKSLQSQWKPTVTGKRSDEQKLWEQFRKAIDAVYDRQRSERNTVNEELTTNLKQKQALCEEIEAFAKLEGDELLSCQYKLADLEDQFNQIHEIPRSAKRAIEQQFIQAKTALSKKIQEQADKQQINQLLLLGEKSALCAKKYAGDNVETEWAALSALQNKKLDIKINKHFETSSYTDAQQQENSEQAQRFMLEIEVLLGLETAETYKQERMQYQVERLSEQMSAASEMSESNEQQALQKIQDWYLVGAVKDGDKPKINERFIQIQKWLEAKAG